LELIQTSFSTLKKVITGEVLWLTPRQQQEMLDSHMALLALTQHKLRKEARRYRQEQQQQQKTTQQHHSSQQRPPPSLADTDSSSSSPSANTFAKEANYYKELAIEKLEGEGAEYYGIDALRNEIQTLLNEQTMNLFESFRSAEFIVNPSETIMGRNEEEEALHHRTTAAGGRGGGGALRLSQELQQQQQQQQLLQHHMDFATKKKLRQLESVCKPILLKDFATLGKLHELQCVPFRERKRHYMHQIMKLLKWDYYFTVDDNEDEKSNDNAGGQSNGAASLDKNTTTVEQILMLTKRIVLKNQLGYSLMQLPSTIPNAGRGLFVDGRADIGSIVAFFPGQVWPREYFLERGFQKKMLHHFQNDDNYELTFRYDDVLIDSRQPFIDPVLCQNNPWAVAQLVNHPPPQTTYNCRPVMLNFTFDESYQDDYDLKLLHRYIPNTYARPPKFLGPKIIEGHVRMHGLVLITTRDVCNEELFMNYRLHPKGKHPAWYTICDEEENNKRWGL